MEDGGKGRGRGLGYFEGKKNVSITVDKKVNLFIAHPLKAIKTMLVK